MVELSFDKNHQKLIHQNLINVSSAKLLKTHALRHIEARFMFTSVAMTDPRGRNMLLDVIRIRHQKALQLFFRCLQTSEILGVVREGPASIALDLSNESDRLARLAEVLCLQRGASGSDRDQSGTNKHADHAQPQHACAAHACVEEDTVCTWPWLLLLLLGGTAFSRGC